MKITPAKIIAGTYLEPYCVPLGWRRYVYNNENSVFEIMDDLTLRPRGMLTEYIMISRLNTNRLRTWGDKRKP